MANAETGLELRQRPSTQEPVPNGWRRTARAAGDRPGAPLVALGHRMYAALVTALSLFLLLTGVGRLMIGTPEMSLGWSWFFVAAGLLLIPLWWRELVREELEAERSAVAGDAPLDGRELLAGEDGLYEALRQWATHMQAVHGMELTIEAAPDRRVAEPGQRLLLFEVVQELLLYMARSNRLPRARVRLGNEDGRHVVRIDTGAGVADLTPRSADEPHDFRPVDHDVLAHLRERLFQVNGQLEAQLEARRAQRVVITAAVETG